MQLFQQNLLQALRNVRNTKWQSLVSVLGLITGIVSMTLSANWLWTETHYDRFRPDSEELYLPQAARWNGEWSSWLHYNEYATIRESLKGQAAVGLFQSSTWESKRVMSPGRPENSVRAHSLRVDSGFIAAARPRVLAGSTEELFRGDDKIVLTSSVATRLFKSPAAAVGKTIENSSYGQSLVVGVVEDCEKESNIYYDVLRKITITDNDKKPGNYNFNLLVRTPDINASLARIPELKWLNGMTKEEEPLALRAIPLGMAHKLTEGDTTFLEAYFYPIAFLTISVLLALSALVNLIMSVTSLFLGRLREYALRRSLGASTVQNSQWMLTELLPVGLCAVLLSAVALEWLAYMQYVPGFADHLLVTALWVVSGMAGVLLLMMLYPLWLMRRAYRRSLSGLYSGSTSHNYLLVAQCFCCALLLFLSVGMQRQMSGMVDGDLGFDRENILRLYTAKYDVYDGLHREVIDYGPFVRDLPAEFRKEAGAGITDAILMRSDIFNRVSQTGVALTTEELMQREKETSAEEWHKLCKENPEYRKYRGFSLFEIPFRAMEFFHIRTENGVGIQPEGVPAGKWPAMLNRKAYEQLGLSDLHTAELTLQHSTGRSNNYAKGRGEDHLTMAPLHLTDVLNVRLTDFHQEDSPVLILGVPEDHECSLGMHDAVYIKHAPGRRADALSAVKRVLTEKFDVDPDKIRIEDMQDHIEYTYLTEIYYANLLTAITAFSVFITFSGVLSLLLYSLRLRRRQMAIRRVMGAEFKDVLRSTLPPYLVFTLLGGVLAYVPAHLFMERWMSNFTRGTVPGPGFMALIVGGMLAVVCLLTWWQVRKAMNEKPVEVLRPEA